jgi:hypothetical protein
MKIESSNTEPPFLIIRDLYNENDLKKIKKEIDFIHSSGCLTSDNDALNSAKKDGKYIKKASGVWLDGLYINRNTSTILKLNRILLTDEEIVKSFKNLSPHYRSYGAVNYDTTLMHYYENEDNYGLHNDIAVYSAVTWFFNKPKKFKGGNLIFANLNFEVEIENNMSIIFPSWMEHKVEEIQMAESDINDDEKNGRHSIAQFMFIVPSAETRSY